MLVFSEIWFVCGLVAAVIRWATHWPCCWVDWSCGFPDLAKHSKPSYGTLGLIVLAGGLSLISYAFCVVALAVVKSVVAVVETFDKCPPSPQEVKERAHAGITEAKSEKGSLPIAHGGL